MANIRITMQIENGTPIEFYNEDVISFYTKTTATNNANFPVFNAFASDGTLVVKDRNLDLYNLATEGYFDSYNYPVTIEIQNQDFEWKQIAAHIVKSQPQYSYVDKTLSIELGNQLDVLDSLTYAGYEYKWQSGTLYDIFADLMDKAFGVNDSNDSNLIIKAGTKITFNDKVSAFSVQTMISIPFSSAGIEYNSMQLGGQSLTYMNDLGQRTVYGSSGWYNDEYKTIVFTDDYSLINYTLLNWFIDNSNLLVGLEAIINKPISKSDSKTFKDLLTEFSIDIPYATQKSFREAFSDVLKLIKCALIIDKNGEFALKYLAQDYNSYNDKDVRVITANTVVDNVEPTIILNNKFDNVEFDYYAIDDEYSNSIPKDMLNIATNYWEIIGFPRTGLHNVSFYRLSNSGYESTLNNYILTDEKREFSEDHDYIFRLFSFLNVDLEEYKNFNRYAADIGIEIHTQSDLQSITALPEYLKYSDIIITYEFTESEFAATADIEVEPVNNFYSKNSPIYVSNAKKTNLKSKKTTIRQQPLNEVLLKHFVQKDFDGNDVYLNLAFLNYLPNKQDSEEYRFTRKDDTSLNIVGYYGYQVINRLYLEWLVAEDTPFKSVSTAFLQEKAVANSANCLIRTQEYKLKSIDITLNGIVHKIVFNEAHSINNKLTKKNVLSVSYSELFQNYGKLDDIRKDFLEYYKNGLRTATLNVLGNYPYSTVSGGTNDELFEIGDAVEIKDFNGESLFNHLRSFYYFNKEEVASISVKEAPYRWQVLTNDIKYDGGAVFQGLEVKQLPYTPTATKYNDWLTLPWEILSVKDNNNWVLQFADDKRYNVRGNLDTKISGVVTVKATDSEGRLLYHNNKSFSDIRLWESSSKENSGVPLFYITEEVTAYDDTILPVDSFFTSASESAYLTSNGKYISATSDVTKIDGYFSVGAFGDDDTPIYKDVHINAEITRDTTGEIVLYEYTNYLGWQIYITARIDDSLPEKPILVTCTTWYAKAVAECRAYLEVTKLNKYSFAVDVEFAARRTGDDNNYGEIIIFPLWLPTGTDREITLTSDVIITKVEQFIDATYIEKLNN